MPTQNLDRDTMRIDPETLVTTLRDETDDGLRAIGRYTEVGYDVWFVRDDIAEKITDEQIDRIHNDLVLQGLGKDHLKQLSDAGEQHCSIHRLDDSTVFHFVHRENTGLCVAIDSDTSVELPAFVDLCKKGIEAIDDSYLERR